MHFLLKSLIFLFTPPPNFTESLKIGFLETLKETPGTYPPLAVCPCEALLNYFPACFFSARLSPSQFSGIRVPKSKIKTCSLSGSNQNGRWLEIKGGLSLTSFSTASFPSSSDPRLSPACFSGLSLLHYTFYVAG